MSLEWTVIRDWVEPTIALLAFLGAVWAVLRRGQRFVDGIAAMTVEVKKLRIQVGSAAKQTHDLVTEVAMLKILLSEREKDQAKLEGKVEQTTSSVVSLIGQLREVSGSLGQLWVTLQVLFPEKVPKRMSDRG